ncbi:hypothetical protein [Flavobacterium succinicans]|uniref:Outer membrane protein beta-barrel domain-containing protein n=1 Tax=Flavobacterium succinicans TaxID=29536 RepID=A0A199XPJ8_9FLAO|nr:hypothetical protein [Flavobacterium succinicans]OAZ03668.1 hypothetical protein FLB_19460 [Flavobacterium succinicans]
MKFLRVLSVALLFAGTISQAQITKGNWMVGGDAFFSSVTNKDANGSVEQSSTQLLFSPNLGYFFIDRLVGGLGTSFGFSRINGNNNSTSGISVRPFLRYYFLKPENRINVLLEANYSYAKDFNSSDFSNRYGFKTGPVVYFNSSVGLEMIIKYEHSFVSIDSRTADNFQVGLGLQIHLEK